MDIQTLIIEKPCFFYKSCLFADCFGEDFIGKTEKILKID